MHLYISIQPQRPKRMWQYSKENQSQVTKPTTKDLASHPKITLPNSKGVSAFQSSASIQARLFGDTEFKSVSGRELVQTVASLSLWDSRLSSKRQLAYKGIWKENQSAGKHHILFFSSAPWCLSISKHIWVPTSGFKLCSISDPR